MNIGIIGLGLMGASFGRTVKLKTEDRVFGYDIDENVMLKANLIGAIDDELNEKTASELDLLILSIYPRAFESTAEKFLPLLKEGAIVLDFCGNKRQIIEVMKRLSVKYPNLNFLGGHPMAGREYSGIDHSVTTLFDRASMLIVPVKTDIFCEQNLKEYFLSIGFGEVVFTDADTHDSIIAYTSQLCHIVSNAFIKSETALSHHGYSAGSYKDLTRVAKLSPEMWSQLMTDNRDKLSKELSVLIDNLNAYLTALNSGDEEKLKKLLSEGNALKLQIDARKSK